MTASTTSKGEVVPLQISTLVMFELKKSTGNEKTHQEHEELETQSRGMYMQEYRTSSNPQSFQTMFPESEQPALQTGNSVTPTLQETGMSTERQDIASSSQSSSGVTQPSIPAVVYPIRREDIKQSV